MPNEPLRVCPVCGGTGKPSFLRSGVWINRFCPGNNGPMDDDGFPNCHELDNRDRRRVLRIEYKRPGESVSVGQARHFQALLESTNDRWEYAIVTVIDRGQVSLAEQVAYAWRSSAYLRRTTSVDIQHDSIEGLARRITGWLWPMTLLARRGA